MGHIYGLGFYNGDYHGTGTNIKPTAADHYAGTASAASGTCRYHSIWFNHSGISGWYIDPDGEKREISHHIQIKLTGQTGGFKRCETVREASGFLSGKKIDIQ